MIPIVAKQGGGRIGASLDQKMGGIALRDWLYGLLAAMIMRFTGTWGCVVNYTKGFSEADERQPGLGITLAAQRVWRFGQNHLEGWPDMCLHQVPAMSGAVAFANDNVRMDLRLSLIERNVAHQGKHLNLLANFGSLLISLVLPIEPSKCDIG